MRRDVLLEEAGRADAFGIAADRQGPIEEVRQRPRAIRS